MYVAESMIDVSQKQLKIILGDIRLDGNDIPEKNDTDILNKDMWTYILRYHIAANVFDYKRIHVLLD